MFLPVVVVLLLIGALVGLWFLAKKLVGRRRRDGSLSAEDRFYAA